MLLEIPHKSSKIVEAIQNYLEQIKTHPTAEAYCNLGSLYALLKKWQIAIAFYRKALQFEPDAAMTYRNLARALMLTEQQAEAIQCWYKAFCLEPASNPEQYLTLGLNLANLGQYQQAIDCYQKMLEVTAQDSHIAAQVLHNYQKVLELNLQATAQDYLKLGKLMRKSGYFQKAILCFQKAIEQNPYFRPAYAALQYTQIAPEHLDQLILFYQKMLQRHGNIAVLWGNLGDALTQKGKLQEAINCYQKSSYQNVISSYPQLSKQNWKFKKEFPPNFVIIGAAKCGTTSLYQYLGFHPHVLLPHKKELDFFSKYYSLGLDWYLSHFPAITDQPNFYTGEASPNYLDSVQVPLRLSQCFPQIKLIVLCRNPVERAISWHYHMINRGTEKRSLETILASAREQLSSHRALESFPNIYQLPRHIWGSLYIFHLKRWMTFFEKPQFLILKSEDLYNNPQEVVKDVFNFLALPEYEITSYPKCNVGSYPPVAQKLKEGLEDFFKPYNQQLESYLNRKFDWD